MSGDDITDFNSFAEIADGCRTYYCGAANLAWAARDLVRRTGSPRAAMAGSRHVPRDELAAA
jgi:hypothetical protein